MSTSLELFAPFLLAGVIIGLLANFAIHALQGFGRRRRHAETSTLIHERRQTGRLQGAASRR